MSRLNTMQHIERKLVHGNLSHEDFDKTARTLQNLTEEFVQDTTPLIKPAVEKVERKGELHLHNGQLRFSLYPPIQYKNKF